MLNLDFICQHPQIVREALRRRQDARSIDDILLLVEQRKALVARCDGLYAALKKLKDSVRKVSAEKRPELNAQIKAIGKDLRPLELRVVDLEARLQPLLLQLPNLPHQSVRDGVRKDDEDELWRWGEPITYHFVPQEHWDLGKRLGILDSESATRIASSRFITLRGAGARLERALISYMLNIHTSRHGYTEIMPPQLVSRATMQGAGQLPKFENQAYACTEEELYLNPTAEVPLVGLHSESILPADSLPVKYVAWTTAYRREVGSASHQTRGLLRLHQFNKVELFQLTQPQHSYDVLEQMLRHAEFILQQLELPYRVLELRAPELPFSAAKTYDLEVWMPGQQRYIEVSSVSNCETFQARRANIRYRSHSSVRPEYVHSLNGSGLAIGRTMAAILETYQQADGTIIVPKVLRPYMEIAQITQA
ncbi:MAG TPA: serine--tRNA ligase [Ktedonobacteraceae bacterium]|jgi:seryl-tRNA synthetase|nr:serine--tRNA ligase [Ktedonobacteraceae bacterium]